MHARELLAQVLDAETADAAMYQDCVDLLDGALRLGVEMSEELKTDVIEFLIVAFADDAPEPWPVARVGRLVNGHDGEVCVRACADPYLEYDLAQYRQDTHVIEVPIHKEVTVSEFVGSNEFVEVAKHGAVGANQIKVPTTPVELGVPELRRQKAADNMMEAAIAATKRAIARLVAQDAAKPEVEVKAPVGDPRRYSVTIAELLPSLVHRTSDGRWFLKDHRIAYRLETSDRVLEWSSKGLHPDVWEDFAGTVMLVPAVMAPKASAS